MVILEKDGKVGGRRHHKKLVFKKCAQTLTSKREEKRGEKKSREERRREVKRQALTQSCVRALCTQTLDRF